MENRIEPLTEVEIQELDPGVKELVLHLRAHGFETTDSGDGVTKPDEERGFGSSLHVAIQVEPWQMVSESHRLAEVLSKLGYSAEHGEVQASYDPATNIALLLYVKEFSSFVRDTCVREQN